MLKAAERFNQARQGAIAGMTQQSTSASTQTKDEIEKIQLRLKVLDGGGPFGQRLARDIMDNILSRN